MMKFGIPVEIAEQPTRLGEVAEVPAGISDAAAWLRVQFPTLAGWVEVPDDISSGAILVDDEWQMPSVPVHLMPSVLSDTAFAELCYAQLGAIAAPGEPPEVQQMAGIRRRGEILLACKNTDDPATFEAYTRFVKAASYSLVTVQVFFAIIGPAPVGSGIIAAEEGTAIIDAWPMVTQPL